jgi:8-amino-7-oxononanoate synthase
MVPPSPSMAFRPDQYSLADFFLNSDEGTDPTAPASDFKSWRSDTMWATRLYEPTLLGAPVPRTVVKTGDQVTNAINLSSYNYLGLGTHPEVVAGAQEALKEFGTGACGSPIMSGQTRLHRALEEKLCAFLQREAVLLFNSGFGGALGCMSGLLRKDDVALVDSKAHMSLMEGVRLSGARLMTFEHNDAADLDRLLRATAGRRRLVVVEGVYSMDGDMPPLPALIEAAESHQVPMLIDEAHSILVWGKNGRGVGEHFGVGDRVRLQYGTFSKAFAGAGGFVAGPAETIDYLKCYANSWVFSCALPPATVGGLIAALDVTIREPQIRERARANAEYFRGCVRGLGIDTGASTTQVVPLIIGSDRALLYELGNELRAKGLFLVTVDYPSVPQDQVRFRASITAAHTRSDLDEALNIIADTIVPRLTARVHPT